MEKWNWLNLNIRVSKAITTVKQKIRSLLKNNFISYKKMQNNLWFLTEERPKKEVLQKIFEKFAKDYGFAVFVDTIRIFPILENNKFTFKYEVTGFRCNN